MSKRSDWHKFKAILDQHRITKLYHFTDRDNLENIIRHGGLYSWADCEEKGIKIPKPGGGDLSRNLDKRDGLQHYVRVSFTTEHPMMYVAMNEVRISNPVILEIDPEVIYDTDTQFSDMNATHNGSHVGGTLADFKRIHFQSVKARKHFDLIDDEQPYFQAEILVKNFIPLNLITNIGSFGIPIPSQYENRIENHILFGLLKKLRLDLAHQQGVPAFVVLSDNTLRIMAQEQPTTKEEFSQLRGIGRTKTELYWQPFTQSIIAWKVSESSHGQSLFECLRKLRLELAHQQSIPAYVVFKDDTLLYLSQHQPITKEDFSKAHGVGKKKTELYWRPFTQVISTYSD